jgi:hypothetical protein
MPIRPDIVLAGRGERTQDGFFIFHGVLVAAIRQEPKE